jgi:hypothetical protein
MQPNDVGIQVCQEASNSVSSKRHQCHSVG